MTLLNSALAYAKAGWPVFPCHYDKSPISARGVLDATTDPEKIKTWWKISPAANIGFAAGEAGFAVIDIDPGANVSDLDKLNLPATGLVAKTPRGGEHWFYRLQPNEIVSPSASRIADHIDVRSFNSYVLLAPSATEDGNYEWPRTVADWSDIKVPIRSDEFVKAANSHRDKDPERDKWVIEPDQRENISAAIAWLRTDARVAVEGEGGDHTAYATAAHLRSFGISEDMAFDLMVEHWNERCKPAWGNRTNCTTLGSKVSNGYEYATSPPGNITAGFKEYHRKLLFKVKDTQQDDGSQVWELGRYKIRNRAAINHIPTPLWLLEGILPESAYAIMYAPEASFKTFLALDMALSIATGFPLGPSQFTDAEICSPGPVLYITGEGLGNIRKRVEGWEKIHNDGNPVKGFNLFSPTPKLTDDIDNLCEFIRATSRDYKLIILDTVSRVMQGLNENAQENASAFTALADALRDVGSSTSILALHHVNKGGSIRGSSVFAADADVVLRVEDREARGQDSAVAITTIKMKDAPDQQAPLKYLLREIDLGEDRTTLVAEKDSVPEPCATGGPTEGAAVVATSLWYRG